MKIVIQRVKRADVKVDGEIISSIGSGLLVFVGISRSDTAHEAAKIAGKLAALRIFEDNKGKMNLNISRVEGTVLSVPQFTLYGDIRKGNRPGFDGAALPEKAEELWRSFNEGLRALNVEVLEGRFGAYMEVTILNDGPVTFYLDSEDLSI